MTDSYPPIWQDLKVVLSPLHKECLLSDGVVNGRLARAPLPSFMVASLVTYSILVCCWLYEIEDQCKKNCVFNKHTIKVASAVFDGVLGPSHFA